jgi:DNA repair exonuclease SbcCD ATPase subunit
MWNPIRIKFQNLFSHKDTEYFFKKNKCVMIYGINSTDDEMDSNGGGKSTIMEAIVLAITNQTSRDIGKEDFINNEEESCFIEFELENAISPVSNLIIRRWIDRKKSTKIQLEENGVINEEMTSVNECNARIYELIGLNREDLTHFFLIGQDTNYSFLTTSDVEKKSIVSRLINIGFIEKKIETLKSLSKEKTNYKNELREDLIQSQTRIDIVDEDIEDLKNNFEFDKIQRMKNVDIEIKIEKNKKIDQENKLAENKSKSISYQFSIDKNKFDENILNQLKSDVSKTEKEIKEIQKKQRNNYSQIQNFKTILSGAIMCPKCHTSFLIDSDIDIKDIPTKIDSLQDSNSKFNIEIESLENKDSKIEEKISEQEMFEERIYTLNRNKRKTDSEIEGSEDEIILIEKRILKKESEKGKIKTEKLIEKVSKLESSKQEWVEINEVLNNEISKVDSEIEDFDFWIINFGKKGFTTFLVNKAIKSIEGITNSYLKKINSNCQIQINGYTTLKSGDLNEKISIEVIEDGFRKGNFLKYSGGEKGRINLANIFGIQHLINLTCPTGGFNILTLDEVFEGLDQKGQIGIIKVLESMNMTSLVVTHRSQPIGAENEIFIEKIKRVSRII